MEEKLHRAKEKLKELLDTHDEHPFTRNHYFMDNRKEIQRENTQKSIQERMVTDPAKSGRKVTEEDIVRIMSRSSPRTDTDMDLIAAEDAFDNMNAYYQVRYARNHVKQFMRILNLRRWQ
jgi:Ca2+-binding EF-hand superfamily protein